MSRWMGWWACSHANCHEKPCAERDSALPAAGTYVGLSSTALFHGCLRSSCRYLISRHGYPNIQEVQPSSLSRA